MHGLFNLEKRENDVFKEDTVLKSKNYLVKKNTDSDHAFAWIYSTVDSTIYRGIQIRIISTVFRSAAEVRPGSGRLCQTRMHT